MFDKVPKVFWGLNLCCWHHSLPELSLQKMCLAPILMCDWLSLSFDKAPVLTAVRSASVCLWLCLRGVYGRRRGMKCGHFTIILRSRHRVRTLNIIVAAVNAPRKITKATSSNIHDRMLNFSLCELNPNRLVSIDSAYQLSLVTPRSSE